MNNKNKVLFLGHDASRTGAPMLLLEFIKWLKTNSNINGSLLLKRDGEIESEYNDIIPTRCLARDYKNLNGGLHQRVLRKLRLTGIRQPDLARLYPPDEYPLVYANTIDTCDLAIRLAGTGRRIIHHVHCLSYISDSFSAMDNLKKAVPLTFAYIAVSEAVRDFLENTIGVPSAKIQVIHGFPIAIQKGDNDCKQRRAVRRQLGIEDDASVIGMCGTADWRKGIDLFVQLASRLKQHRGMGKCHFLWLGGSTDDHKTALHDITLAGLTEYFHLVPRVPDPEAYFHAMDLYALTSREDPFSLAMLEAALCGLPIVCFANAGGAPELVEDDAGLIVPYLDVPAMAKACAYLLTDEPLRKRLGMAARTKVQERYTLALQGPKLRAVIESVMTGMPAERRVHAFDGRPSANLVEKPSLARYSVR